ncbi:hypothetical protein H0H93_014123 [Arthromyces matolae]|nr:hypothetical protein H0H93_014123 [Arthromyces matolae]
MAMEYYSRETLKDIVSYERALNTERALFFACEVVQALTALHATGIIHRDLRPEHVLVDDAGHIVVEGFESSEIVAFTSKDRDRHPVLCSALVGNISVFSAPELLLGWSHDYLVDTWAFGALLLFMLSGKDILRDRDTSVVDWKEMIVNRPIILPLFLESAAHDLISECLERNPMARPSLRSDYFAEALSRDWKKVAAKRIRVPSGLYTTAVRGRKHFRARLEKVVSAKNRARGLHHTQTVKPLRSSETISTVTGECSNSPDAPQTPLIPQKLIRMQGEEPKELDQVAPPLPDSPVDCASALDDLSSNAFNLKLKIDSQNRMASFWDSLDAEEALESTVPSPNVATPRPRKLRKARSEIYSSSRGSTFGTRSLQNLTKLGKFGRSTYVLPHEKLQLPEGIKQIGGGIGFQYKVPAAARSKASIGTSPPQTCRGFFQGRLQGLGIEILRSPAIAKEKAKRSLKNLLLPVKSDVQCLPPEWKGSSWSLLMPASPESDSDLESSVLATVGSSPTTEDRASTPNSAIHDAVGLMETQDFDFEQGVMLTGGHMTLRLVAPAESKEDIEYARM